MKKLLFFILAITIILTVFSISVFAEGEYAAQTDGSTEASVVTEIEEKNIFSELYGVVARHADKIFSALAFLGSLIIAFAYRHGLLPVIKGALSAMGAATSKLKEETEAASGKAAEAVSAAAAKLATAEEMLSAFEESHKKD